MICNFFTYKSNQTQETILYATVKCNCTENKQLHAYNTRNNDYHRYVQNLEPSVGGCIFNNKLPNSVKQISNNTRLKKLRFAIIQ